MKDYLTNLITRKQTEMADLQRRSDESQDLAEVRAIGTQLEALKNEITEAQAQLDEITRSDVPESAELRNAQIVSTFGGGKMDGQEKDLEYRQAFMEFILRGTAIPKELRGTDASTTTSDVASVIPTVVVNRIVEKMENIGMILPLVTKTAFPAGVEVPTSSTKPVASWVAEGASSDKQKKTTSKISFTYHKLRCEISMSMEVSVMALSAFEAKFADNVAKAMVKAIEDAIINGTGSGQPKGILAETAPTGQALTVTDGAITYADLCAWESAIPEEYEATAKWCMSKKTFMAIQALVDDNGQPVARVNYGLAGRAERSLLGRDVVLASAYMDSLDAEDENTFAFAFDFEDYLLNTVYDMGITKKQDWDTEDMLTKAVMSVDGKAVSVDSLVTVSNVESV